MTKLMTHQIYQLKISLKMVNTKKKKFFIVSIKIIYVHLI